jgi:hypothetical protein
MISLSFPLIPANAGTQIAWRGRQEFGRSYERVLNLDLGPGIRRDERVHGIMERAP